MVAGSERVASARRRSPGSAPGTSGAKAPCRRARRARRRARVRARRSRGPGPRPSPGSAALARGAGARSVASHAATASTSSRASGRSPAVMRTCHQLEHVPLGLGDAPCEHGALQRRVRALASQRGLPRAVGGPLGLAEHVPPAQARRVDLARRSPSSNSSTLPKPAATRSSAPKRQGRAQTHARSSAGSPRCQNSQSTIASRPSSPTMKLPSRKSPWTTPGAPAWGCSRSASAARARAPAAPRRPRRAVARAVVWTGSSGSTAGSDATSTLRNDRSAAPSAAPPASRRAARAAGSPRRRRTP